LQRACNENRKFAALGTLSTPCSGRIFERIVLPSLSMRQPNTPDQTARISQ